MRVLVTGGSGFLGKHLIANLHDSGHETVNYDNLDPLCGGDVEPDVRGDVTDYSMVEGTVNSLKITHIAHLAAYGRNLTCQNHEKRALRVNIDGARNVLLAAYWGRLRIVVCSSNIVLSERETVYRRTKGECEREVKRFASGGGNVMALRPSNMHGSGQSRTEYQPCCFAGMDIGYARDGHFTITGDGTQTRDFVHVDDVARAFLLALESDVTGETIDIATGVQTSMNEIAALLKVPVVYTDPRPGDAKTLVSDAKNAQRLLGFKASLTLAETIHDSFPAVLGSRGETRGYSQFPSVRR